MQAIDQIYQWQGFTDAVARRYTDREATLQLH